MTDASTQPPAQSSHQALECNNLYFQRLFRSELTICRKRKVPSCLGGQTASSAYIKSRYLNPHEASLSHGYEVVQQRTRVIGYSILQQITARVRSCLLFLSIACTRKKNFPFNTHYWKPFLGSPERPFVQGASSTHEKKPSCHARVGRCMTLGWDSRSLFSDRA